MKKAKKLLSVLLSFVMLLSVFTLTGTYAEEETGLLGIPPDGTQEETVVDEDGSENDVYPDGTRSVYHFFLGAYSDGDLLTFSNLHSSPTETRYSDGNNNNHKYQKWEISYYNSHYTLYPLGGENPYALTVNPTTLAVTVEPYYSTDVCQRWDITILGHGRIYLTSLATGTDAYGYKLVVNGSSVTVSSSSYTTFLIADYDTYVGSTSLSYGNFYLAPGSTRTVFPTNQTGLNVPTGAIKLTSSNSKVAVSYNIVTGKTSGTATLTIKDKITNAQTTCTVNVTPIANATYYLKNRQTDYYARVKNGTMADGTNAVQYELDGTEYEKWQFSLNSSTGYYTIKSKGSSSAYYLTVKDSVSTLNQEIVLGTSSTANGAQWKVVATTNGAYKLVPKTGENAGGSGVDYVLATNTSLHTNNANLIQGKYLNNSSYRDEWFLIDVTRIYGYKDFRTLPQSQYSSINCHGYAMFRNDMPSGWTTTVDEYIANVAATTGYGPNDYSSTVKHNVSEKTRIDFENWLSTNGYSWVRESSFSENGSSNPLLKNQYRVVLRTGIHNVSFVADGIPYIWQKQYDYHFWYQTYDGTWANKHGHLPIVSAPEQLPSGVTPLTGSTSGWNLSYYKSDYSLAYTYENFYDGDIYVYIITVS